jgi:hypothetical protein
MNVPKTAFQDSDYLQQYFPQLVVEFRKVPLHLDLRGPVGHPEEVGFPDKRLFTSQMDTTVQSTELFPWKDDLVFVAHFIADCFDYFQSVGDPSYQPYVAGTDVDFGPMNAACYRRTLTPHVIAACRSHGGHPRRCGTTKIPSLGPSVRGVPSSRGIWPGASSNVNLFAHTGLSIRALRLFPE